MDGIKDAYLLEYEKLKEEQVHRIQFRDNMRYVTLGAIAVAAAEAKLVDRAHWLAIPLICVILGWNSLDNAHVVKRIGKYIEESLSRAVDGSPPAFQWETYRRDDQHVARQARQFLVDEITFFLPCVIALVVFALDGRHSRVLWAAAGAEVPICLWIGLQIWEHTFEPRWLRRLRKLARLHVLVDRDHLRVELERGAALLVRPEP